MSYKSPQTTRNPPPSNRQLLIIFGIFASIAVLIIWAIGLTLDNLIFLIPSSLEQQLGNLIVPIYERQSLASPVQNTLNRLLERLEQNLPPAQTQGRNYQVLYIPQPTINALAIPGDRIILYKGLLKQVESENELMMVLGHELGHFAHRDHLRGLARSLIWKSAIALFLGDSNMLESMLASAVNSIATARYSQSQEQGADEFGLVLLNQTNAHVAGATDFFLRMSKEKRQDIAFLSTHPAPEQRVKNIENLIKKRHYSIGERSPLSQALINVKLE